MCGAILYTEEHVHVRKMLDDDDYWSGLDSVSGPEWAVFAVRAESGSYQLPSFPSGTVGLMIPVWKEPKANLELLADFGMDDSRDLPALVVFIEESNRQISSALWRIRGSTADEAYTSTAEGLRIVGDAIREMEPEARGDGSMVRRVTFRAIEDRKDWLVLHAAVRAWEKLLSWIPGL